ncbi:MAG: tetratricopeptide repeat protein [Caldilineaceae bacterium]|nr:tetratricopeptide repeat protein [Caldilineaceae bacterium]
MEYSHFAGDPEGAHQLPAMVGRDGLMRKINDQLAQQTSRPHILFLTGNGGIGKTRVLLEVLGLAQTKFNDILSPDYVVDLYHIQTHTPDGLAEAVWNALPPTASGRFSRYEAQKSAYARHQSSGDSRGLAEQHEAVLNAFWQDLAVVAGERKLLLMLDTAEKAVYTTRRRAEEAVDIAESWEWLARSLSIIPNALVIVAGRPQCLDLNGELEKRGIPYEVVEIPPLSEAESLAYWDEVISHTQNAGNEQLVERLNALDARMRRSAHFYSDGLPIVLSLLIDYLSMAQQGDIPAELRVDPAQVQERVGREPKTVREELEKRFVERFIHNARLGDTIDALGRAPKGVDANLLSRLLNVGLAEAERRLEEVRKFSFVKQRPTDKRFFLHDVMYEILKRHLYDKPTDASAGARASAIINQYYSDALDRAKEQLDEVMQPVWEGQRADLDFHRISQATIERQTVLAEIVYYRLRQDPGRGFLRYYRYMREAILSGQVLLDLLLQTELLTFWNEEDPTWEREEVGGIPRHVLEGLLSLRPVTRAWAEGDYPLALERVDYIRKKRKDVFGGRGTSSIVDGWEAFTRIMIGGADNLARARALLDDGIDLLTPAVSEDLSFIQLWRVKAVLAFCHRVRGYLNRIQGNIPEAVKDYRIAARLWRDTTFLIEQARTLNDLGFALSEQGQGADARALVNQALKILVGLGQYALAGLSVNTLAMIEIKQGNYGDARHNASRALGLFRSLQYRRGTGLALIALAEATRRYSAVQVASVADKVRLLREARDCAWEAVAIFRESKSETDRLVEAQIEVGCACRDWTRLRRDHPNPIDNVDRLKEESRNALEEAATLAGTSILHRHVDALVNLAWLGQYTRDPNLLSDAAARAEQAVPQEYRIDPTTGTAPIDHTTAQRLLWPQLGKLYNLYGSRAFNSYSQAEQSSESASESLRQSIRWHALGLEHSALYSENYQGLVQAKEHIFSSLNELSSEALVSVAQAIESFERGYSIRGSDRAKKSQFRELLESRALWYGANGG